MMRIIFVGVFIAMLSAHVQSYGPGRKSMSFSLTLGPSFTGSTFAEQEDKFTSDLSFHVYKTDPVTGLRDSSSLKYRYYDLSGEAWAIYYPVGTLGAGLFYRVGQVTQKVKVMDWNVSGGLFMLHRAGLVIQYWPEITDEFGFSLFIPAGAAVGELTRVPVLEANYQHQDIIRDFIKAAHETVKCSGMFTGLSFTVSHKVTSALSAALIVDYEWTWVHLSGDKLVGYPQNDFVNEIGIKAGVLLLASRNRGREIY
jgi:hypothetical protein